jgi:hypothetical protein
MYSVNNQMMMPHEMPCGCHGQWTVRWLRLSLGPPQLALYGNISPPRRAEDLLGA